MSQDEPLAQRREAQHEAHVLPITALAYLNDDIVLSGEGIFLCAYAIDHQKPLGKWRIFEDQAIHGIVVHSLTQDVLVYGGRFVRLLSLEQNHDGLLSPGESTLLDAEDWILDACFDATHGALITAHNALLSINREETSWSLTPVVSGSNAILYSAHITSLAEGEWLVAAGTAFGDILIWSCKQESETPISTIHYSFSAHQGSTFGVRISDASHHTRNHSRLLASCSDDRTVRIWDLSGVSTAVAEISHSERSTGFGVAVTKFDTARPPLLAKAMGHVSRIWHVRFDNATEGDLLVRSFGEDATTVTWTLQELCNGEGLPYFLLQQDVLGLNSGKHLWAVATRGRGQFAVGGADGVIASILPTSSTHEDREIISTLAKVNTEVKHTYKAYAFIDQQTLIMTTDRGRVLVMEIGNEGPVCKYTFDQPELAKYSVVASTYGAAFAGGSGSTVFAYLQGSNALLPIDCDTGKVAALFAGCVSSEIDTITTTMLLITQVNQSNALLKLLRYRTDAPTCFEEIKDIVLELPPGSNVTSSTLRRLQKDHALYIVGSRNGSIAVFEHKLADLTSPLRPCLTTTIHTEAVTSLYWHTIEDNAGNLLSASRDGTYAIHKMTKENHIWQIDRIHQLKLPFGPNIEGLSITEDQQLLIWGFKGKHFVAYSATQQREVYTIDCGGVHRTWAVQPTKTGITFTWSKASKVFVQHCRPANRTIVKRGGHGREIKSMAISKPVSGRTFVATGAQDTDIRLWTTTSQAASDTTDELICLHVLRQHNTGPQHLVFSDDGQYLFSSGGFEEFCVWRITQGCPVLDVGVVCESIHPHNGLSDLRITGFDVRKKRTNDGSWDIFMAYSDSRVGMWSYHHSHGWTNVVEANYLTSCPTAIYNLSVQPDTGRALSVGTDGHIVLWQHNANDHKLDWTSRHQANRGAILASITHRLNDNSLLVITGGDDNAISFTRIALNNSVRPIQSIRKAHAAAVTALDLIVLPGQDSETRYLLSAGLDQRLILWQLSLGSQPWLKVQKLQVISSSVADICSIGILPSLPEHQSNTIKILISGVGMETWTIPLPD